MWRQLVLLDGREALSADFVDKDDPEKGGKRLQFAGSQGIDVPAGLQSLRRYGQPISPTRS